MEKNESKANHNKKSIITVVRVEKIFSSIHSRPDQIHSSTNNQAMTTDISSKRHVLMIDNYDSFTWNLYQYLHQSPKCGKVDVYRNDKITISQIENEIKPDIIFISPGPGHPLTDSGISRDIIKYFLGKILFLVFVWDKNVYLMYLVVCIICWRNCSWENNYY